MTAPGPDDVPGLDEQDVAELDALLRDAAPRLKVAEVVGELRGLTAKTRSSLPSTHGVTAEQVLDLIDALAADLERRGLALLTAHTPEESEEDPK